MVGQKFGLLTVLAFDHYQNGFTRYWRCQCECGNIVIKRTTHLMLNKGIQACPECVRRMHVKTMIGRSTTVDDRKDSRYFVWRYIKRSCYQPTAQQYHKYGGRFIQMEDAWLDFRVFRQWLELQGWNDPASRDYKLCRYDEGENFTPENCYVQKKSKDKKTTKVRRNIDKQK